MVSLLVDRLVGELITAGEYVYLLFNPQLTTNNRLESVIGKYEPMAVMHFAAYAYVGESVANPSKYYRNNVAGTLHFRLRKDDSITSS